MSDNTQFFDPNKSLANRVFDAAHNAQLNNEFLTEDQFFEIMVNILLQDGFLPDASCLVQLERCINNSSNILEVLDCEITAFGCVKKALLGQGILPPGGESITAFDAAMIGLLVSQTKRGRQG